MTKILGGKHEPYSITHVFVGQLQNRQLKPISTTAYNQMKTNEFPKYTRVAVIDTDEGYFIQRQNSDEELAIRFNTPKEAIDYCIANQLLIITNDVDA